MRKFLLALALLPSLAFGQTVNAILSSGLPQAAAPTYSPVASTYGSTQTVTVSSATGGAAIYCTFDGSVPSTGSTLYTAPLSVALSQTVSCIATASGYSQSYVSVAQYVINQTPTGTPILSSGTGSYTTPLSVTMTDPTPGASIYYCLTSACVPTTGSTLYTGAAITFSTAGTSYLNAIGHFAGYTDSAVASATYTLTLPQAATPTFSPAAGPYTTPTTVTINCPVGVSCYYTTNGSTPTTGSTLYSAPFVLNTTATVKAIATQAGYSNSAVGSATYTLTLLTITTTSLPAATVGVPYTYTVAAINGTGTYTWTLLSGPLSINSTTGTLTATPGTAGTFSVTVAVTDQYPSTVQASFPLTINAAGATQIFSYPSGFASAASAFSLPGHSNYIQGSAINVTPNTSVHGAGAAWYKTQQSVASFTDDFTFQRPSGMANPTITCMSYSIQNGSNNGSPYGYWGINAIGDSNMCGFGAYDKSGQYPLNKIVSIKFDLNDLNNDSRAYPAGGSPSDTGLYLNGGTFGLLNPQQDLHPSTISFYSGDVMAAHVVYDGTLLTMVLKDNTTNAQARFSWPVNIAAVVGSSNAWFGFTGGTVPVQAQNLLTWTHWSGYNTRLATPTFSVPGGSYGSTQTVTVTCPGGATCYYTTNGQQPTSASTAYTTALSVSANEFLQVVAIESGFTDSLVATANYQISAANTINFSGGFSGASGLITPVGTASFNGSQIQLTDATPPVEYGQAGAAWYVSPVTISTFSTTFTFQMPSSNVSGMTFTIQNQNPSSTDTTALVVSGGPLSTVGGREGLGYSQPSGTGVDVYGLQSSVAVKFDRTNNSTGLYTNGALPGTATGQTALAGITLSSGHPITVTLSYDGTTLSELMTDTVTLATFSKSWTVNIPSVVGGSTAYVGFTGSVNDSGNSAGTQFVNSWTF